MSIPTTLKRDRYDFSLRPRAQGRARLSRSRHVPASACPLDLEASRSAMSGPVPLSSLTEGGRWLQQLSQGPACSPNPGSVIVRWRSRGREPHPAAEGATHPTTAQAKGPREWTTLESVAAATTEGANLSGTRTEGWNDNRTRSTPYAITEEIRRSYSGPLPRCRHLQPHRFPTVRSRRSPRRFLLIPDR